MRYMNQEKVSEINLLRKMQNIQTIQFECLEHPEYRTKLPESITSKYTKEEIKQAFINLKWEYKE